MDAVMIIEEAPLPKIVGRGRKRGLGSNFTILNKLEPDGKPLFGVPRAKMLSLRNTAWKARIRLRVRRMPDDGGQLLYAIQRRK